MSLHDWHKPTHQLPFLLRCICNKYNMCSIPPWLSFLSFGNLMEFLSLMCLICTWILSRKKTNKVNRPLSWNLTWVIRRNEPTKLLTHDVAVGSLILSSTPSPIIPRFPISIVSYNIKLSPCGMGFTMAKICSMHGRTLCPTFV